ncbi:MAG: hypothetical protein H6708_10675 [Kofleriaceae bacterium]|nr:hypothetical protein [Myxococcales bacterium]MCB9560860.1 hypothetical protein [Kofleriaceae bacterium]
MLPRLHLFEWNDQAWLPEVLRRGETDYLAAVIDWARPFSPVAPELAALVARHGGRVVDLASGGLGPWRTLRDEVAAAGAGAAPEVTLTDLYPNLAAFERSGLPHERGPVDAREVPATLPGIRTMFDALHHHRPADARAILADAHRAGAPIVVAEATSRRVPVILVSLVLIPLLVLVMTPRIRPLSGWRLLFTYLIPILPLLIWWDGIVSCLRTYRPAELEALTAGLDGYRWQAREVRGRGSIVTYLIGEPVAPSPS